MPIKTMAEAINEAQRQLLAESRDVFIIGEGAHDPKACFGTNKGLKDQFPDRVWDMPVSENGMTGVCIGAAAAGMRPIMVHMRADFLMYAMDQIVNQAAKLHAMYGGQLNCPMVIRAIIGRGWGQGLQHSQHFEKMFSEIEGLTAICPSNAYDAKGMLIWASQQKNPIIFFEHRWTHDLKCEVPDEMYEVKPDPIGLTNRYFLNYRKEIKTYGYLVHEAMEAAKHDSTIDVWDMRGPVGANWVEKSNCPPSPHLSKGFYPTAQDLGAPASDKPHDVPNPDFRGPF